VKIKLEGIIPPHITPFTNKDEIDEPALRKLIHFWLDRGLNGLMACGSNGEAPYLSREERRKIAAIVIDEVNGKVPVIAGTGAPSTKETILLTQDAADIGVDAAIVVTPYYFKPNSDELIAHYSAVLNAVDVPVILYNVPKFTGYNLNPTIVVELVEQYSQIIALKDSSGSFGQIADIIRQVGEKISVFAGTGDLILSSLLMGGMGGIVGVANVAPRLCSSIFRYYKKGQLDEAKNRQMIILQLNNLLTKRYNQISCTKEVMNQMGLPAGYPRRPCLPLKRTAKLDVSNAIQRLNLVALEDL
jgi:4-hydroxy-tetrahydrodipicolinate synthase